MKIKFTLSLILIVLLSALFIKADTITVVSRVCIPENVTDCAGSDWKRETCTITYSDYSTVTTIRYYLYDWECQLCMLEPVEGCF